jgi:hypothetical protein
MGWIGPRHELARHDPVGLIRGFFCVFAQISSSPKYRV